MSTQGHGCTVGNAGQTSDKIWNIRLFSTPSVDKPTIALGGAAHIDIMGRLRGKTPHFCMTLACRHALRRFLIELLRHGGRPPHMAQTPYMHVHRKLAPAHGDEVVQLDLTCGLGRLIVDQYTPLAHFVGS